MRYWGKLLGLVLGVMYAPGVVGALLGLLVGHMVDRALGAKRRGFFADQQTRQSLFSVPLFKSWGI